MEQSSEAMSSMHGAVCMEQYYMKQSTWSSVWSSAWD
jgi:hypothetical protein